MSLTRTTKHLTASGLCVTGTARIVGFYVNSTTSGTLQFFDNTSGSGTQIGGTMTPAVGWNPYPADFQTGLFAVIAGTALDVTVFVE